MELQREHIERVKLDVEHLKKQRAGVDNKIEALEAFIKIGEQFLEESTTP